MQEHVIVARVVDCLEHTTRYPRALLTPDANLADDLGIDSVKQVEIVVSLEEAFGIKLDRGRATKAKTIADVAAAVRTALRPADLAPQSPGPMVPPPPAPAPLVPDSDVRTVIRPPSHAAAAEAPRPKASTGELVEKRSLEGRIALVTGSGRGLGRTVAHLLARRGATVVVNSFHSRDWGDRTATDIEQLGGNATHIWGSVANGQHVERIFREIEERFGGVDILVCNASDGRIGPFLEMSGEDWERAFRTNVAGHHACARLAAPQMAARGGGSIVLMSTAGAHQYVQGFGCQGVVKAAVESLTRYLACELAPHSIRANCVAAGPVYGPLLDQLAQDRATKAHWEAMTPGGTLTDPLDVARAIAFLVSDDAVGINGAVWAVDRGFSAHVDGRLLAPALQPLARRLREAS